jgi:hypothetical protein
VIVFPGSVVGISERLEIGRTSEIGILEKKNKENKEPWHTRDSVSLRCPRTLEL